MIFRRIFFLIILFFYFSCEKGWLNKIISPPGCTDISACNYDPDVVYDDSSCLYNDCNNECGGDAVLDVCEVCNGDNSYCPTATDINGNVYLTIQIGNQHWMKENLKVTKFQNGNSIPNITNSGDWGNVEIGAYGIYPANYDVVSLATCEDSCENTYGILYNWYAINDERGICPEGWHVPTDDEWKELEIYLGMNVLSADSVGSRGIDEGGKLKEMGANHWNYPNSGSTNIYGFTALPGGYRHNTAGDYEWLGRNGFFWTSSQEGNSFAWGRTLSSFDLRIYRDAWWKHHGYSIRCVK